MSKLSDYIFMLPGSGPAPFAKPEHQEALCDVYKGNNTAEIMVVVQFKDGATDDCPFYHQGDFELPLIGVDIDWSGVEQIVVHVLYNNSDWSCKIGHIFAHDTQVNAAHVLVYGLDHPMVRKDLANHAPTR